MKAGDQRRLLRVVLQLFVRGEFRIRDAISLIGIYSAVILSIPLLLNSIFNLSSTSLSLVQSPAIQNLLYSVYREVSSSYVYVDVLVFLGFGIVCLLTGMAFGRRVSMVRTSFLHMGSGEAQTLRSILSLLFFIEGISLVLGLSLAVVASSAIIFSISTATGLQYVSPSISFQFLLFFSIEFVLGYACLGAGLRTVSRKPIPIISPNIT